MAGAGATGHSWEACLFACLDRFAAPNWIATKCICTRIHRPHADASFPPQAATTSSLRARPCRTGLTAAASPQQPHRSGSPQRLHNGRPSSAQPPIRMHLMHGGAALSCSRLRKSGFTSGYGCVRCLREPIRPAVGSTRSEEASRTRLAADPVPRATRVQRERLGRRPMPVAPARRLGR